MLQTLASAASFAGTAVVTSLWQGLVLAAVVWLCLRLAPRATAAQRFAIWAGALFLVCVLPLFEHSGSRAAAAAASSPFHLDPRWSYGLLAVWATASLLRAGDLLRHALRLRALGRHAVPVSPFSLNQKMATLLERSRRRVEVCTSNDLPRPGVIGFFRPRVLIPAWLYGQLTGPELEQILLHEVEHLRRRDDWLNLFQKLMLVLFPLNPGLHWIERRLCIERELACDEGVVRRTRAPRLYATCLAKLAERGLDRRGLSLALGFLERQSELGRRVGGILRTSRVLSRPAGFALGGTLAVILLGGTAEMARCPQLVSFGRAPALVSAQSGVPLVADRERRLTPVLYPAAAAPRLLRVDEQQTRKPLAAPRTGRTKLRRTAPPPVQQRAAVQGRVASVLTADAAPVFPAVLPMAPTLVRYTLVRVEGGWILVQL